MDVDKFRTLLGLSIYARRHVEILHRRINIGNRFLAGYCCIASRHLLALAQSYDIDVSFLCGWFIKKEKKAGHCWIERDGFIIDLTATQFGINKKVYVTESSNPNYCKFAEGNAAIENTRGWIVHNQKYEQYQPELDEILKKENKEESK